MKIFAVPASPALAHFSAGQDHPPQPPNAAGLAPEPQAAAIRQAVDKLRQHLETTRQDVRYHIHDKTHRLVIQIVDRDTDAVIEEVPPSKILDMIAAFTESSAGGVDKKA